MMIIARLNGQLGNQLFVYATAYAVAKENNEKLAIYKFEYDTLFRSMRYGLGDFKLQPFNRYWRIPKFLYVDTLGKIVARLLNVKCKAFPCGKTVEIIQEKQDDVAIQLDTNKKKHVLQGYWQSPVYFDKYRDEIVEQIVPDFALSSQTKKLIYEIGEAEYSASLHIRRGDYLKIGWCISMDYYVRAMSCIASLHEKCKFYVFSDDIAWVKENLPVKNYDIVFVERDKSINPFEDIWLMAQCRANIIANSSFSWWGAYLNQNQDKFIIAPKEINRTIKNISEEWEIM